MVFLTSSMMKTKLMDDSGRKGGKKLRGYHEERGLSSASRIK
jgi:hypothetical protein